MPTLPVQLGVEREVWFAPLASPGSKSSFLSTDHAYTRREEQFGRQIRLGNPVNLGPNSNWSQLSWEGGTRQEVFNDPAMFMEGSADPQSRAGKLRMWSGFRSLVKVLDRPIERFIFGKSGLGNGTDSPLYVAEALVWGATAPPGGFQLYEYGLGGGNNVKVITGGPTSGTASPKFIMPMMADTQTQGTTWISYVTANEWWIFDEVTGVFTKDTAAFPGTYQPDGAVPFLNGIYYLCNNSLCKRLPGTLGVIGQHSIIRTVQPAVWLRGITVYNNRIYYGVQFHAARAAVEFSDGVTAQRAFEFPEEFTIMGMISHYGSLYIYGGKRTASGSMPITVLGQVWRYNGSSLIKLYEAGDPKDGQDHTIWSATTYNQNLVFTESGFPPPGIVPNANVYPTDIDYKSAQHNAAGKNATLRPGLVFYDAEKDAIIKGPSLDYDPANSEGIIVNGVVNWDNSLAVSFRDLHNYKQSANPVKALSPFPAAGESNINMVAQVRFQDYVRNDIKNHATNLLGVSFDNEWPTKSQYVLSGRYAGEADVALEKKTWLVAKVRINLPSTTCRVRLCVLLDEGTEVQVGQISNANGWQTWVQPLKINGDYPQSVNLQYKLYLENTDVGNINTQFLPEVDDIWTEWTLAPKQRRSWRLRLMCQNGQLKLNGAANPLATKQGQVDAIEALYIGGKPVYFWGPLSDGSTPGGTGTEVKVTEFQEQSYRIDDQSSTEMSEVSITLVENVIT